MSLRERRSSGGGHAGGLPVGAMDEMDAPTPLGPVPAADADPPEGSGAVRAGLVWSSLGFAGTKAISLLSTLVLARLLAPAEFGALAAIVAFTSLIELASDLGLGDAVVYEQEHDISRRVQTAFTVNLGLAGVLATVGVLIAPLIADFFRAPHQVLLFRLAALGLMFTALGNIQDSLLLREMRFRKRILADLTRSSTRAVVAVVLALVGFRASALVIGLLAGSAAWVAVQWMLTSFRPTFALDRDALRSMGRYGSLATALEVLAVIANRADVAVIGRVLGSAALGLYSVAFRIPELVIESVAWNLSLVAFPAMSRQRVRDEQGLGPMTLKLLRYQVIYSVPIAVGLAVLAPSIMTCLFGAAWRAAAGVLAAVAVTTALGAIAFPLGDVFKASGRQGLLVMLNLAVLPLYIAAIIVAAPAGIVFVGWIRAATRLVFCVAVTGSAARIVSVGWGSVAAAAGPGVAAGAGVLGGAGAVRLLGGLSPWPTLIIGTLAGVLGGVVAMRLLAPRTLRELFDELSRLRPRRPVARAG